MTYRHGHAMRGAVTRTYKGWQAMMTRCYNPKQPGWENYGGRGIAVCERWHDFVLFREDMGDKPVGHSIERIDNDKGYEPGNCRWGTRREQNRNKRNVVLTEDDVRKIRSDQRRQVDIAADYGVKQNQISRIKNRVLWADIE